MKTNATLTLAAQSLEYCSLLLLLAMTEMHVPLILAIKLMDAYSLQKIAQELTSVTLDLAIKQPENAHSHLLFVTITMHVLLTVAIRLPENVYSLQRAAMTTTHVLLIAVTEILDCVSTLLKYAMTSTCVLKTLAMSTLENVSLKISLLK